MESEMGESISAADLGVRSASVASFVVGSRVLAVLINALTLVVIARLLSPVGFGVYTLALAVALFFGALSNFRIGQYINSVVPKLVVQEKREKIDSVMSGSLMLLLLANIPITIIAFLLGPFIATSIFHSPESAATIMLASLNIVLSALSWTTYFSLTAFGDGKRSAISLALTTLFQSIASIILIMLGGGAFGAILGTEIGLLLGTLLTLKFLRRHAKIELFNPSTFREERKEIMAFSTPLLGLNAAVLVSNFGVILLGALFLPSIVGAYGVASKVGAALENVIGSIDIVLIPMFATALAAKNLKNMVGEIYNTSIHLGFMFITPMVIFIVALSYAFVLTIFSSAYLTAVGYMALIAIGELFSVAFNYSLSLIMSTTKVKEILRLSLLSSLVQLIGILLLVPQYGAIGLIVSVFIIGGILNNFLYLRYISRTLKIRLDSRLMRVVLVNAILLLALWFISISGIVPILQLVVGAIVLALVYPILLGVFRAIDKGTVSLLRKSVERMPFLSSAFMLALNYLSFFVR